MQPEQSPTIVLADDDQFITVAYKAGLEQAGYRVLSAANGEDALVLLRTERPDVLLLDLIMPRLNGFEVLAAMKVENLFARTKVIVLTNLSQPSDEAEVRSYPVADFLVKADIAMQDLVERIQIILSDASDGPVSE